MGATPYGPRSLTTSMLSWGISGPVLLAAEEARQSHSSTGSPPATRAPAGIWPTGVTSFPRAPPAPAFTPFGSSLLDHLAHGFPVFCPLSC